MATSASTPTLSIGTAQTGRSFPQSNPFGLKLNSHVNFKIFSSLKAMSSSLRSDYESPFSSNKACVTPRTTFAPKVVRENPNSTTTYRNKQPTK